MPKGGARVGAGRPKDLTKAAARLERIRAEMQNGFYESAFKMARGMPDLMDTAMTAAKNGDKGLLKFLIAEFHKIIGALPSEDQSKYAEHQARIISLIENASNRSRVVDSDSESDSGRPGAIPLEEDDSGVFRGGEDQASDGGRA